MKTRILSLLALIPTVSLAAEFSLPQGAKVVLPRQEGVSGEWILPPSPRAKNGEDVVLATDPHGAIWLVVDQNAMLVPEKNAFFKTDRPFQQILWLSGLPLARSYSTLGRFEFIPEQTAGDVQGLTEVHFKPLATIPMTSWRAAPAGAEDLYIAGYNPRKKASQIALLGPAAKRKGTPLKILYETKASITDVAGDGHKTYFASGPAIWQVEGETAKVVYAHPRSAIRRILFVPGTGLFYATDESVGFAGTAAQFDFIRAPHCQIAAAGDALYVMMGRLSGGVLRVRGASQFAKVRLAP
jgi:hypothetical protein